MEEIKNLQQGAFAASLRRNNSKIREDRAETIGEDAEMRYKRKIEDLEVEIKKIRRERESMIDLSPTNADSLMLAVDFKSEEFVEKDIELGVRLRNLEIKIEIATERYKYLFTENSK